MSIAPTDGPDNALELVGVGRRYSTPAEEIWAVRGVSLTVEFGSFVALMGPSGSGKSTLLSLCAGLDDATTGRINVMGAVLAELSQAERADLRLASLGVVFQDHNLIEQLTALENVALPMEALGMGRSAARQAAATALANCGVGELAARYPGELSGGQQQRVGIARAIVGNRRVLLADEPTGALDSENTRQLFDLIRTRCDHGLAAVVATHDESVAQFADQVVRIADGEVLDVSAARA